MKSIKKNAGFTLVELMIAMVVSMIVVAAIYSVFRVQRRTYTVQEQVAAMQQNLRAANILLGIDVRMAGYDPLKTNNYGITTATSNKFVFTADLNNDGGAPGLGETMTYELYNSGTTTSLRRIAGQSAIADNIISLEFRYLDADGNDLGAATAGVVPNTQLKDIRTVQVSILARAGRTDPRYTDTKVYTTAGGNLWGPFGDNYRRRFLKTTIVCRNMGV